MFVLARPGDSGDIESIMSRLKVSKMRLLNCMNQVLNANVTKFTTSLGRSKNFLHLLVEPEPPRKQMRPTPYGGAPEPSKRSNKYARKQPDHYGGQRQQYGGYEQPRDRYTEPHRVIILGPAEAAPLRRYLGRFALRCAATEDLSV